MHNRHRATLAASTQPKPSRFRHLPVTCSSLLQAARHGCGAHAGRHPAHASLQVAADRDSIARRTRAAAQVRRIPANCFCCLCIAHTLRAALDCLSAAALLETHLQMVRKHRSRRRLCRKRMREIFLTPATWSKWRRRPAGADLLSALNVPVCAAHLCRRLNQGEDNGVIASVGSGLGGSPRVYDVPGASGSGGSSPSRQPSSPSWQARRHPSRTVTLAALSAVAQHDNVSWMLPKPVASASVSSISDSPRRRRCCSSCFSGLHCVLSATISVLSAYTTDIS